MNGAEAVDDISIEEEARRYGDINVFQIYVRTCMLPWNRKTGSDKVPGFLRCTSLHIELKSYLGTQLIWYSNPLAVL